MSVSISASKSAGLASWFEASASLPPAASSTAEAARVFTNTLHEAAKSDESGQPGQAVSGLARVFCPGHAPLLDPKLADAVCPFGTGVPQQDRADPSQEAAADAELPASAAGLFRDVPEESIEPFNAVLFWRRPENPPELAGRSKLVLAEALRQAGYDPKEFAVSYWETKGEWPGGMMIVPQLTVVAPNGRKADLSPELVVRSPRGAVEDIRRLMETPGGESTEISSA